jgi:hypothetical protein
MHHNGASRLWYNSFVPLRKPAPMAQSAGYIYIFTFSKSPPAAGMLHKEELFYV